MRRWVWSGVVLSIALVVGFVVVPSLGATPAAHVSKARAFSGRFTSQITNQGTTRGDSVSGVVARGTFSARLSPAAAMVARLVGAVTGVPYAQLAKGGSFVARYSIDGSGTATGLFVAKLKSKGLGSECFSFKTKQGQFQPGDSFVPVSGTFKLVGGSGGAARLRGSGKLDQTDITGTTTETTSGRGSASLSAARKAKKPSAACKSVR
jgi:hypothetical protein